MRTIRLTIAYDGTDFSGFQTQPGRRTVQKTMESAIEEIIGTFVRIEGAGRTDTGVHASGQVISFRCDSSLPSVRLARAIDAVLPTDVAIVDSSEVGSEFHARYSARGREYRYSIWNATERPILERRRVHHWRAHLDEGAMSDVAKEFVGCHDFAAFAGTFRGRRSAVTTVRVLHRLDCWREKQLVLIDAAANGFLPHMVRNLAGTLIRAGMGQLTATDVRAVLAGTGSRIPGITAPSHGLCLTRVWYD